MARQVAGELVPVDHGFAFTALALLRRPGRVAREYVDGCTVRYVGPVKYFLLLVSAAQVIVLKAGIGASFVSGIVEGYFSSTGASPTHASATAVDFTQRYFVSLTAVWVPVFAAGTRLLFRRARLNYAEHLVPALYTAAQQCALVVALVWISNRARALAPLVAVGLLAAFAYEVWALRQFTGVSAAQATWRTAVAAALTMVAATIALAIALAALAGA